MIKLLSRKPTALRLVNPSAAKIKIDRKSGSAGMPRPISYAVFCLKKKMGFYRNGTVSRVPLRGMGHVKHAGAFYKLVHTFTNRVERAAGVRPGIFLASPKVSGRTRS